MVETRKIEIELSNKTRQTAECTISQFVKNLQLRQFVWTIVINYPLLILFFEYYKNAHYDERRHVFDELIARDVKAIVVNKRDILTKANVYALESTLKNGQFMSNFRLDINDSNFMQVGYITNDDVEYIESTVLNDSLRFIVIRYAVSVYNDIIPMSKFEQSDYYTCKIRLVKEWVDDFRINFRRW